MSAAVDYQPSDREQMILRNRGLVVHIAKKYFGVGSCEGFDAEDIIHYGILGLIHAVDRFDVSRGLRFSSYATRCIAGYILTAINRHNSLKFYAYRNNVPLSFTSIDQPVGEGDDTPFGDFLSDDWRHTDLPERAIAKSIIHRGMAQLSERLRRILFRRYWLGLTLDETGRGLRISGERARQLLERALEELAAAIASGQKNGVAIAERLRLIESAEERARIREQMAEQIAADIEDDKRATPAKKVSTALREIKMPDGSMQTVAVTILKPRKARGLRYTGGRL